MNLVNWFEIPVTDLQRAKQFYSKVFNVSFKDMEMPGMKLAMFPGDPEKPFATGALVLGDNYKPTTDGVTIYFYCDQLDNELKKIEEMGGKIINPKTSIGEMGFIAHFIDSEGNKIALHSMK